MNDIVNKTPIAPGGDVGNNLGSLASSVAADHPGQSNTTEVEKVFHVFYSSRGSVRMCLPTGKPVAFMQGKFMTDDPEIVAYLKKEVYEAHNPYIYVKEGEETIAASDLDPMVALRKKIVHEEAAKIVAEAKRQLAETRDMGQTKSADEIAKKTSIGSTKIMQAKDRVVRVASEIEDQEHHQIGTANMAEPVPTPKPTPESVPEPVKVVVPGTVIPGAATANSPSVA